MMLESYTPCSYLKGGNILAINFDKLPQENPFSLPEPGLYKATIEDAEMRHNKNDATKPPYLNMKYKLTDMQGKSKGVMFDIIAESDSSVVGYKIARFCRACGLPLQGSIELSDLAKIVRNKEILVDVKIDDSDKRYVKAVVDLFTHEAYYRMDELEELKPVFFAEQQEVSANDDFMQVPEGNDEGLPFNEPTPSNAAEY